MRTNGPWLWWGRGRERERPIWHKLNCFLLWKVLNKCLSFVASVFFGCTGNFCVNCFIVHIEAVIETTFNMEHCRKLIEFVLWALCICVYACAHPHLCACCSQVILCCFTVTFSFQMWSLGATISKGPCKVYLRNAKLFLKHQSHFLSNVDSAQYLFIFFYLIWSSSSSIQVQVQFDKNCSLKCQPMRMAKRRAGSPGADLFSLITWAFVSLEYVMFEIRGTKLKNK